MLKKHKNRPLIEFPMEFLDSEVIVKTASYEYNVLKPLLFEMIDSMAGVAITKQTRVLIKPNLLLPARPERAILTHPLVVKAVAEYVINKGGDVLISDSPAWGSFEKILKIGGYQKALEGLDVELREFKTSIAVDIGKPFGSIELAKDPFEADVVINLAKLKTHSQMLLTLGVKNLFGCIIGFKKPEWHLRSGVDRDLFAGLLAQIYQTILPSITIVDGILALEGQGPAKGGTPRYLGLLIGSKNAFTADMAICRLLGLNPDRLPTHRAGKRLGLVKDAIDVIGDAGPINHFAFPLLGSLSIGPKPFQGLIRKHLVQRPVVDDRICRACGDCLQFCPAKAIAPDGKSISFDYDRCIRCYCCIEICPHGAIRSAETLPGMLVRRFFTENRSH